MSVYMGLSETAKEKEQEILESRIAEFFTLLTERVEMDKVGRTLTQEERYAIVYRMNGLQRYFSAVLPALYPSLPMHTWIQVGNYMVGKYRWLRCDPTSGGYKEDRVMVLPLDNLAKNLPKLRNNWPHYGDSTDIWKDDIGKLHSLQRRMKLATQARSILRLLRVKH